MKAKLKDDGTLDGYISSQMGDMTWTATTSGRAKSKDVPIELRSKSARRRRAPRVAVDRADAGHRDRGRPVARRRHRRQHRRVLVGSGRGVQPHPRRRRRRGFHLVEPRTETGSYPGASWLEYRDLRERLRRCRDLLAFRMVPLYVGEPAASSAPIGLLVSGNYFSALGLRPALGVSSAPTRSRSPAANRSW